jgi:hypothetical protein
MEQTAKVATSGGPRIERSKSKITVDSLNKTEFTKEGTLTAQIRQKVVTKSFYPSKKTSSDLSGNVFANSDFGFTEQEFESVEERVAWIPVPEKISSEEVQKKLDAAFANGACIYRVLASHPILDENQKYAVSQGIRTLDQFANTQALRYPENPETVANETAGKLILDKSGNVQYRRTFFWATAQVDVDIRDAAKSYLSAELQAELAGASVMQGQTI